MLCCYRLFKNVWLILHHRLFYFFCKTDDAYKITNSSNLFQYIYNYVTSNQNIVEILYSNNTSIENTIHQNIMEIYRYTVYLMLGSREIVYSHLKSRICEFVEVSDCPGSNASLLVSPPIIPYFYLALPVVPSGVDRF